MTTPPLVQTPDDHLNTSFGWVALAACLLATATAVGLLAQWYGLWSHFSFASSDLSIFRGGGELVRHAEPLYQHKFWAGYWTYPPFGGTVMLPLTLVPVGWLFPMWTAGSIAALFAIVAMSFSRLSEDLSNTRVRLALMSGLTIVALVLTPISDALGMGQIGIFLTALCLFDVVVLGRKQHKWMGVLVGIAAAVKLTPGLFIFYFLVTRQWRAAFTSSVTFVACWTISAVIRWQDTKEYFQNGLLFKTNDQIGGNGFTSLNQSLYGTFYRLSDGRGPFLLYLLIALTVTVGGLTLAKKLQSRGDLLAAATLIGLTSVLVSPISWHHHAIWVVPALGVIVGRGRSLPWNAIAFSLLIGLSIPLGVSAALTGTAEWFVLLYCVLVAAVLAVSFSGSRGQVHIDGTSPRNLSTETSMLNTTPEAYFRDAYEPVMYSGAIGVYSALVHRLMERGMHGLSTPVILELGAGAGQHAAYVRSKYETYYETDVSIVCDTISTDPETGREVVRTAVDAQDLSRFGDASVDRVIATCLLAHLPDPEAALWEWRRVLRPGGTLAIYVPAEPGFLLRSLRRVFVVPKARKLGQDHLAIIYRDHRNHYPAMRTMVESIFGEDQLTGLGFPTKWVGWNFRLFDIYFVNRSPDRSAPIVAAAEAHPADFPQHVVGPSA